MVKTQSKLATSEWSAAELRLLPAFERDRILMEAAERAESDYRTDEELTAFEAFGKEDLYGSSSNTQPG